MRKIGRQIEGNNDDDANTVVVAVSQLSCFSRTRYNLLESASLQSFIMTTVQRRSSWRRGQRIVMSRDRSSVRGWTSGETQRHRQVRFDVHSCTSATDCALHLHCGLTVRQIMSTMGRLTRRWLVHSWTVPVSANRHSPTTPIDSPWFRYGLSSPASRPGSYASTSARRSSGRLATRPSTRRSFAACRRRLSCPSGWAALSSSSQCHAWHRESSPDAFSDSISRASAMLLPSPCSRPPQRSLCTSRLPITSSSPSSSFDTAPARRFRRSCASIGREIGQSSASGRQS